MKTLKVCFLAGLLFAPGLVLIGQAAPKTEAQINRERAQVRAAQKEAKARQRTREHQTDLRNTARDHRNDKNFGDDVSRNADEAHANLKDTGKDIRDWFGW